MKKVILIVAILLVSFICIGLLLLLIYFGDQATFKGYIYRQKMLAELKASKTFGETTDMIGHDVFRKYNCVAHAFGSIDGINVTNTFEAFQYNYTKGTRLFETDIINTNDGVLVDRHDWDSYLFYQFNQSIDKNNNNKPLSFRKYKWNLVCGKYTPMAFSDVLLMLKKYRDAYIILDIKDIDEKSVGTIYTKIVSEANGVDPYLLNRIIPQIYNEEMLGIVNSVYKFKTIIYTLYRTKDMESSVIKFARNNNISAITMPEWRVNKGFTKALDNLGVASFVHTIDSEEGILKYRSKGIGGYYSNLIDQVLLNKKLKLGESE
jgi:glycerophosphoryl diester phosphodiesterase